MFADDLPSWKEVLLRGHRTFPITPWRADSRWHPRPLSIAVLLVGLSLFGIGEGLLFNSRIGNSPWVVLAEGISLRTGLDLGIVTFAVSVAVLALWIPLRERPGLGTIANIFVIAAVLDAVVKFMPPVTTPALQVAYVLAGTLMVGLASSLYITCQLGPGPRDGLMTALHNRTGIRVSRVRLSLELVVLTIGFLLGGKAGVGTLIFALGIGRSIALWLGVVARLTAERK